MDEQKAHKKAVKRAYKRARRRTVLLWKFLAVILILINLVVTPADVVLHLFNNTVAAFAGGTFWTLKNADPDAQYFTGDFDSVEAMAEYGLSVCQQVEAEGAVLLMNEQNALPLPAGARVSLFSSSSVNLVYSGTGSGNIGAGQSDTLRGALEKAGFSVNGSLWDFYLEGPGRDYVRDSGGFTSSAAVGEAPWSVYTDEVKDSFLQYGDAAIVVLSRVGGEGVDLAYQGTNYLALDANERDMMSNLARLKAGGVFQRIIVLINSANPLQVDFLKDNEYGVDGVLWIGNVGVSGVNAVAMILNGAVNPSGRLADTYCYDNMSSPAMCNFTPITYDGIQKGDIPDHARTYMIYQEGIYVGYKYYETRYEDTVMGTGYSGDYVYSDDVAFPFGCGLSYTTFEYSDMDVGYNASSKTYTVSVKVTNTGRITGKETVQIYAQTPYTDYDRENGIEKASVQLVGFGKTQELAPGASETLRITVNKRDLASYDAYGAGTYILDAGDYYLTAAADAHNAVNNILAAKGYAPPAAAPAGGSGDESGVDGEGSGEDAPGDTGETAPAIISEDMDGVGNAALTYTWTEDALDAATFARSANGTPIVNRLSSSDLNLYKGSDASVTWLSRNNWTRTMPTEDSLRIDLTEQLKRDLQDVQYDPADYPKTEMPVLAAKNGLTLYDMIGRDYDDPDWDTLLDQLTFDEMVSFLGDAFHWTMPLKSIQAPGTRDENGPQGLTASLLGSGATQMAATAFPSEDVMAATFNLELMAEVGKVIGNNCLSAGVACLYGPGNNIHRTPYGGRNFEYYSEDGFLSGKISAAEVAAIQAKGVQVVMKHFALNDCEQDRIGLGVWLTEQAAREIYLKAFQTPIEEGNGNGVMMAYTRWGARWSGGNQGLGQILRDEWGCTGMNISDNVLTTYVNGPDGLLAGTSIYNAMMPYITNALPKYKDDPVIVSAMREACHHNLYAIANSCGMNGVGEGTTVRPAQPILITLVTVGNCVTILLMTACIVMWILNIRKLHKMPEYLAYKEWELQEEQEEV